MSKHKYTIATRLTVRFVCSILSVFILFCTTQALAQAQVQHGILVIGCKGKKPFKAQIISVRDSSVVIYTGETPGRAMLMDTTNMNNIAFSDLQYAMKPQTTSGDGHFWQGALIGGLAGSVLGLLIGSAAVEEDIRNTDDGWEKFGKSISSPISVLGYGGLGLLGGALLGGIIGSASGASQGEDFIYTYNGPRVQLEAFALIRGGQEPPQISRIH